MSKAESTKGKGADASRSASRSDRVQVKNPVTNRWVKLDTTMGRIVDTKKSPGPYKGVLQK